MSMSDRETITAILDSAGIVWTDEDEELPVRDKPDNVKSEIVVKSTGGPHQDGYSFFYACLLFDDDGALVKWENWE